MSITARFALAIFLLVSFPVSAADMAASRDYPLIKRFAGSEIVGYTVRGYDEYLLALGNGSPSTSFEKSQKVEGKLIRIVYRVPGGHTSLEVYRNYQKALADAGFQILFEQPADTFAWNGYFMGKFYLQSRNGYAGNENSPFDPSVTKLPRYLAAKLSKGDHDVVVGLLVEESNGGSWSKETAKEAKDVIVFSLGDVIVGLDVIETQPGVLDSMVQVKSEDMAKALAEKGTVNIYGIYFDTDKTELKSESTPTLDEIAKLLKGDPGLKLKIAGHTDNVGAKDHNVTLSLGRAAAVVDALVTKYGIDKTRLEGVGYGDAKPVGDNTTESGRAKNRRVELSKM